MRSRHRRPQNSLLNETSSHFDESAQLAHGHKYKRGDVDK